MKKNFNFSKVRLIGLTNRLDINLNYV